MIFDKIEKYSENKVFEWQKKITLGMLKKMNKLYSADEMKFVYKGIWFSDWENWKEVIEEEIKENKKMSKEQLECLNRGL